MSHSSQGPTGSPPRKRKPRVGRPAVFVSHDLGELGRAAPDPLEPLRAIADCRVWPQPRAPRPDELAHALQDCEGLLCVLSDRVDASLLEAAPRLRAVSTISVGTDHIDLAAARARGIVVGHTPGVLTETTAELALALMLAVARRLVEADRFVRSGVWAHETRWSPDLLLGRDLAGSTLGIVGLGPIGQAVAARARAFDMRVVAWSRTPRTLPGVEAVELDALLACADFVSLHVALADATRHLIDRAAFGRMKPGAILINTARGPIVDEVALADALASGRLGGAGLDVFEVEPLRGSSPLLGHERVVLAPHIGSASVRTRRRMLDLAVANLLAGLTGEPLPHRAV